MTQGYRPPRDIAQRFWEKVDMTGPCWLWTAAKGPLGYGSFMIGSRTDETRQIVAAHRVAYWLEHGFWSTREQNLHHRCENTSCVRPSHLAIVSSHDHIREHDNSPPARNAKLTHCRKCGRELAGDNLLIETGRRCRTCRNAYMRELKRARRRANPVTPS